jgi:inorganic phosphate transporter, PiT family
VFGCVRRFFQLIHNLLDFDEFNAVLLFFKKPGDEKFINIICPVFYVMQLVAICAQLIRTLAECLQLSIILKIAAFIFLAPLIGMVVAFGFTLLVLYICRRAHPHTAEVWFKKLQLVSSALFSIGHGLNDSQKVMGIIAAAMIAGHSEGLGMGINSIDDLPDWVAFSCFTAISLGTMSGGWKIVKTMGTKITKVTPLEGVIAETAGAFTLYLTEYLKIPVSTTHTITGAIIGVGATKRLSAVRWGVTKSLMTAWVLTIPVSALLAAGIYCIVSLF